jgi:hypothetical protein
MYEIVSFKDKLNRELCWQVRCHPHPPKKKRLFFNGFATNGTPSSAGTSANFVEFRNTGGDFYIGQEGSTAGGFFTGSSAYASVFYSSTAQEFIIGGTRRLQIASTGAATFSSSVTATSFIKSGGTSSQFLKADGSVDSNTYATNSTAVLLAGTQTITGNKTFNAGTYFEYGSFIKQGSISQGSGYTGLGACVNGLSIGLPSAIHDIIFPSTTGYDYTFPALTGTVAVMDTAGLLTTTSLQTAAPSGASAATWKLGNIDNATVTHDRVLYVEVGGTTYSILASTTI